MDDQIVLITGTSKGIGLQLAEHFVKQNWIVIGCSRGESTFSHPRYRHYKLDVSDEVAVQRMFREIKSNYHGLDALINNAGIASMNHFLLTPSETARSIFRTNFEGTFLFCREAGKMMSKEKCGRIINFTSVAVPLKLAGESVYAASKAAVITLTQILAKELAPFGVTVNAIGPTPVETDLIRSVPKEKIAKIIEMQAIPRLGEFKDIVNVVDFFIKRESDFVTGQTIFLGGV